MLTFPEFASVVRRSVPELRQNWLNPQQENAVSSPLRPPTLIVAGPGSGKTTVLALRVLKLILVDDIPPASIIATTFTRKAAEELRSRILSWGYGTVTAAAEDARRLGTDPLVRSLSEVDVNSVPVGTIDSLAEQFIQDCRPIGGITPTTIERFLSRGIMREQGLFVNGRFRSPTLTAHLNAITPHFPYANAFTDKLTVTGTFAERVRHDVVDLNGYAAQGNGQAELVSCVRDYMAFLGANHLTDFARLEELLLEMIRSGHLARITNDLRAILVDEFQDTNYIQEQIYIELCRTSGASLTVVGDDDQSIFRFRGATVEIFSNFANRIVQSLGQAWRPNQFNLFSNYRSTPRIVDFCQSFIQSDQTYQAVRAPNKVGLVAAGRNALDPGTNIPVLGMFRNDCQTLANDVSALLLDIFRGGGRLITCGPETYQIARAPGGDFGDAVLLAPKVRESAANNRMRLPHYLRTNLEGSGVRVFNPRGRDLGDLPPVRRLLGIVLECIDPNSTVQNSIQAMSPEIRAKLNGWRQSARDYVQTNPQPRGLANFVLQWGQRVSGHPAMAWPRDWPLLELIFAAVTWIPELQSDPEGQVYLEAAARAANEVGQMGSYRARILSGTGVHDANSVREAIRGVFEGLAAQEVDVDEDIMPYVPRNYFPIMTVHQAKGLEFPLVILDVGGDFSKNHHTQARFRFPNQGDNVHAMEDAVAQFCAIGPPRSGRPAVDRAWDDLRRLYFVAFSRPQNLLLLIGLTPQIRNVNPVPCLALGDVRNGQRQISFVEAANYVPGRANTVALI
jgi:DNA helicase-2/ATP-dependent DNA helicase PcrA